MAAIPPPPPAKPRPQHEDVPLTNAIPAWLGVGQARPGLSAASPLGSPRVGPSDQKNEAGQKPMAGHPEIPTRYLPTVTVACHNEESAGGRNKAGAPDDQEVPPPSALHTVVVSSFEVCEKAAHLVCEFCAAYLRRTPDRPDPTSVIIATGRSVENHVQLAPEVAGRVRRGSNEC